MPRSSRRTKERRFQRIGKQVGMALLAELEACPRLSSQRLRSGMSKQPYMLFRVRVTPNAREPLSQGGRGKPRGQSG